MSIEQLILLAIVQGITEFLPVSSSAHLILLPKVMAWQDQGTLIDVAVHVGSLGAVALYFWKDVVTLFNGLGHTLTGKASDDRSLFLFILAATLPILAIGYLLYATGLIQSLRSMEVIGWTTIIFGIVLWVTDKWGKTEKDMTDLTWKHVMTVGLAQTLSLIPGTSRSGITITAARSLGYTRSESARFSMLLALPTISAFGLYTALELFETGSSLMQRDALIALGLSFVSAYAAIGFFMKLVERTSLLPFVIYRLVLGAGLLSYVYF